MQLSDRWLLLLGDVKRSVNDRVGHQTKPRANTSGSRQLSIVRRFDPRVKMFLSFLFVRLPRGDRAEEQKWVEESNGFPMFL